jgi:DNA modification methylase
MMALDRSEGEGWIAWQGDNVELMKGMPEGSIDLTVTSIPFANLLTYSASNHDLGNCVDHAQFFDHFAFTLREWLRVTKAGRIVACHVMNLPSLKMRDGHIGLIDFRGDTIRAFQRAGFIYHAETVIWKNPVTAMQRSKALGLLHKQIKKDSAMSRMGIPDTVLFFRKPGDNPDPVSHTNESFSVERWQRYASPVWVTTKGVDDDGFAVCVDAQAGARDGGIHQSETLQARSVREDDDERHLAPLQLEVIRRCIDLYSNPRDVVFDPFGGIGSTGVVALENNRRAVICELKRTYYQQAVANLARASSAARQPDLFSLMGGAS